MRGNDSVVNGPAPTPRPKRLEAPHRRVASAPRGVEIMAVLAYRSASWVLGRLPARPSWTVIGWLAQASYLLWPTKRRASNRNFAHVLGTSPGNPAVRRLALGAYRSYARYLVEIMQLPQMTPERAGALLDPEGIDDVERIWRESSGVIFVACHVGNNEAIAAGIGHRGWPLSGVADDSTFPELFEILRRERARWGARVIPWRNLREVYGVLRRGEMLALLLDWGYRPDGIPVRLFDAWTTLPAGPATLAAKTGAVILPVVAPAAPGRSLPRHDGRADPGRIGRSGRAAPGDPGDRRCARAGDRRGAGPVVQLQADVAGHGRGDGRPGGACRAHGRGHRAQQPGRDLSRAMTTTRDAAGTATEAGAERGPRHAPPASGRRAPGGRLVARLPAAGGPPGPAGRARRRAVVPARRPACGPGPSQPPAGRRLARRQGARQPAGPGGGGRPGRPGAARPLGLPSLRALLPGPGAGPVVHAAIPRRTRPDRAGGQPARSVRWRARDLHRPPLRGDRAAGLRRRGPCPPPARLADGDDRRPGPPALLRPDPGLDRDPDRRAPRGPPRAGRCLAQG